jgi:predicted ATP-dependent endonuclease of OLD family
LKLVKARVQNYRSVEDCGEFEIGKLTCLVGKNEAGKTAILSALRGLRPSDKFEFDKTNDYPRRFLNRYEERHPEGTSEVIRTWWRLDENDLAAVEKRLGAGVLIGDEVEVCYGFGFKGDRHWTVRVDNGKCLEHLMSKHALDAPDRNVLHGATDGPSADKALSALANRSAKQEALLKEIKEYRLSRFDLAALDVLNGQLPTFFYTSHFERMSGEISIEQLHKDVANNQVKVQDKIFLDFLAYAGTDINELVKVDKRIALKAQLEAAGNEITEEIFQFWSQNNALEVTIDFDPGKPGDPPPFNTGTVASIQIRNTNHKAKISLSERSAGFVWFFSFLAQFKQLKKSQGKAILLLDEPGLTLHGKAQADLLKYIEERLLPDHQVVFTTHSPFMVPMKRLADVRIVEDVIEPGLRPVVKGTKVRSDVLHVDEDTLFPLQGALGYEITQSLFIGENTWLVEGPSDILYLNALSEALKRRGRRGMDPRWVVCPSGGIDKIAPFVRLFGGNRVNVAVLSDVGKGDVGKVEKLRREEILKAGHFYTAAEFAGQAEADIEDLLDPALYVEILNVSYKPPATHTVTIDRLRAANPSTPRIVKQAEALFKLMPSEVTEFGHYRAAEWLLKNPGSLDGDSPHVLGTLARAENVFAAFNALLP